MVQIDYFLMHYFLETRLASLNEMYLEKKRPEKSSNVLDC